MKCQNLFSGKNKKNISKKLLNSLPRVLSINVSGERKGTAVAEEPDLRRLR